MTTASADAPRRNLTAPRWAARLHQGHVALSRTQELVLAAITQHRLMTTGQLRELVQPDHSREFLSRQLARLAAADLVASARVQGTRNSKAWWVTPTGRARISEALRPRQYVMSAGRAESNLQRHTLLVNQIGVEFARWARQGGHECGPLDWDNEIGHRIRDGDMDAATMLVSDLRIRITLHHRGGDTALMRLVEADRGTETVHILAEKIRNYCRLLTYVPAEARRNGDTVPLWRRNYSAFPKLLIVFADRAPEWMRRRANQLMDLCRADPLINQHLGELGVLWTTITELVDKGPFTPIFHNADGAPTDLLGRPPTGTAPRRRSP